MSLSTIPGFKKIGPAPTINTEFRYPCEGGVCSLKTTCKRNQPWEKGAKLKSESCIGFGFDLYVPTKEKKEVLPNAGTIKKVRLSQ